ncbi:MAG: hypothetical protein ACYSUQ_04455 [Planctomycetota bacterium]|jgi:hypothetical protein
MRLHKDEIRSVEGPGCCLGCGRVDKWLREAEGKAGVEKLEGRLWHGYRAKFATEMVDVPDPVVAKLGGWKAVRTLDLYQQPSDDMMLEALEQRRALREVAR